MNSDWRIFLLMVVIFAFYYHFSVWAYKLGQRRRHMKFMRAVQVEYPNAKLSFYAIDTSDETAMAQLKQKIEENRYEGPQS